MINRRIFRSLALLATLFAGFATFAQDANQQVGDAQGFVERLVSNLVSSGGQKVDVFELSIGLTGNVRAGRATVSDVDGAWLEITDFNLDWSPFSLLRRTVQINSLDVGTIDLKRWPGRPPTQSTSEPVAPRPVNIDRFRISEITLSASVAAEAARLSADGTISITTDPVRIAVDTRIDRIDAVPGLFEARVGYQPETRQLDMDIRGVDGPSGLIANLLNIPGRPRLDLALSGEGSLDDWNGDLSLKAGTDQAVTGDFRLVSVETGRRLGVALEGSVAPFLPSGFRPAVEGRSVLAGSVVFPAASGPMVLEMAVLETAAVKIDMSGTIDPRGDRNRIQIAVETPADETNLGEGANGPVSISDGRVEAVVFGDISEPQWRLFGRAGQIRVGPDDIRDLEMTGASVASGDVTGFSADFSANFDSRRTEFWTDMLRGDIDVSVTGTYDSGRPLRLSALNVDLPDGQIRLSGTYEPGPGSFDLVVDAALDRLQTGSQHLDRLLAGQTELAKHRRTTPFV